MAHVRVSPLPSWMDLPRLLGEPPWQVAPLEAGWVSAEAPLDMTEAVDVAARLRGLGFGGRKVEVEIRPRPKRNLVRRARTDDARRRRDTTPGFTRRGARLDEEGRRSLTPEAVALAMGQRAAEELGREATVLDVGCGAGGNSIGFARAGLRVVAVEPDPQRLADARHNARLYGVDERIRFVAGRAEEVLDTLEGDLLFLDPPWGAWERSGCGLDDVGPLRAWLERARPRFPRIDVKVPPSFDPSTVPGTPPPRAEAWFGEAPGDRRRVKHVLLSFRPEHA